MAEMDFHKNPIYFVHKDFFLFMNSLNILKKQTKKYERSNIFVISCFIFIYCFHFGYVICSASWDCSSFPH